MIVVSAQASSASVLFVAVPAALGGSNRSLATLMCSLGEAADRALAAPASGPFRRYAADRRLAAEFIPLPHGSRPKRLAAGLVLAKWVWKNRRQLKVIHAQALTGLNLVTLGAVIARIPVVVRVSDPDSSFWGRRLGPIIRRLIKDLRVVPVSETAKDVAVLNGLCAPHDAVVVPNPVDPLEVRATTRVGGPPPVRVGFLGGATRRKGYDVLEAVVGATAGADVRWKLFMAPPEGQMIPPGAVDVMGRVADVREAYAVCDIVFVPSRSESFCRVVAEAMVNGIPVVASDIPPIRTLIGDEEAGLLFPLGDHKAAAAALRRLVEDEKLRNSKGAAGRKRARTLEPASIATRLALLYGLAPAIRDPAERES